MRTELFYNPLLLTERLGQAAADLRRLRRLRETPGSVLQKGHIDSLELLDLLRPLGPKVIYDVGANVGTWTLLAKSVYPEAQIHCFEPLRSHLQKLSQATETLSEVTAHQICLGSAARVAHLRVLDFSDASSLLPLGPEGEQQWGLHEARQEVVHVELLDSFVSSKSLPFPDLLKLDVQGYEVEVLKGAAICLQHALAVLTEVSFREFYESQCLFHDVVAFMGEHGFWLAAIGQGVTLGRPLVQCDTLFVKKELVTKL